jgi:hypothetical protein
VRAAVEDMIARGALVLPTNESIEAGLPAI